MTFPIGFFLLALVGAALQILFIHLVRRRCPDEWIRLGSPRPLRPSTMESNWKMMKYFLRGGFAKISDRTVITVGRMVQIYTWLGLIVFALFTILFFYAIVTNQ